MYSIFSFETINWLINWQKSDFTFQSFTCVASKVRIFSCCSVIILSTEIYLIIICDAEYCTTLNLFGHIRDQMDYLSDNLRRKALMSSINFVCLSNWSVCLYMSASSFAMNAVCFSVNSDCFANISECWSIRSLSIETVTLKFFLNMVRSCDNRFIIFMTVILFLND